MISISLLMFPPEFSLTDKTEDVVVVVDVEDVVLTT